MERETGIEPATSSLGSWHSTAELLPLTCSEQIQCRALNKLGSSIKSRLDPSHQSGSPAPFPARYSIVLHRFRSHVYSNSRQKGLQRDRCDHPAASSVGTNLQIATELDSCMPKGPRRLPNCRLRWPSELPAGNHAHCPPPRSSSRPPQIQDGLWQRR